MAVLRVNSGTVSVICPCQSSREKLS
jgi:hypothetical protein